MSKGKKTGEATTTTRTTTSTRRAKEGWSPELGAILNLLSSLDRAAGG